MSYIIQVQRNYFLFVYILGLIEDLLKMYNLTSASKRENRRQHFRLKLIRKRTKRAVAAFAKFLNKVEKDMDKKLLP